MFEKFSTDTAGRQQATHSTAQRRSVLLRRTAARWVCKANFGAGTTFHFTIPAAQQDKPTEGATQ